MSRWWGLGLWVAGAAWAGDVQGYRGDGTGRYEVKGTAWHATTDAVRWRAPSPAWSNAAVVLAGSQVCTTAEPTTLWCVDARTGTRTWIASNDVVDTLAGDERTARAAQLAQVPGWEEAYREGLAAYSRLRREVRADPSKVEALQAAQAGVADVRAKLDAMAPYLTPPDKEVIGYASATPVFDGEHLYAQFAQGVVSSFALDGRRRWSVWLGPPPGSMRGYHTGAAASPVLLDGVLVVGHGHLQGLDPASGKVLWKGRPYLDYGSPTPLRVGGVGYLATPDGQLVRAKDGTVVAEGLGDMYFTSPLVHDGVIYYLGGQSTEVMRPRGYMEAKAWRVAPGDGGTPQVTPVFDVRLANTDSVYSAAAWAGGKAWFLDRELMLRAVDPSSGVLTGGVGRDLDRHGPALRAADGRWRLARHHRRGGARGSLGRGRFPHGGLRRRGGCLACRHRLRRGWHRLRSDVGCRRRVGGPVILWVALAACGWVDPAPPVEQVPPDRARCDTEPVSTECYLRIPGGTFRMGAQASDPAAPGYDPAAAADEGPIHDVTLSPFWIQRHEYVVSLYRRCVAAGTCPADGVLTEGPHATLHHPTDHDLPVVGATAAAAEAACAFIGGRLPTEAEWEFAARGSDGRRWPWGDMPSCGVADRQPDGTWSLTQPERTDCATEGVRVPAEVRGPSAHDVVAMGGNVWEWTADGYDAEAYARHAATSPHVPPEGGIRVQRGGGWTALTADELRATARQPMAEDVRLMDVGFRCVFAGTDAPGFAAPERMDGGGPPEPGPDGVPER